MCDSSVALCLSRPLGSGATGTAPHTLLAARGGEAAATAFAAMTAADLARCFNVRNSVRQSALRKARCECALRSFLERSAQQQQWMSGNNNNTGVNPGSNAGLSPLFDPSSINREFRNMLDRIAANPPPSHNQQCFSDGGDNNDVAFQVESRLLPSYWLCCGERSSSQERIEILRSLLHSLSTKTSFSIASQVARGCAQFGESVSDCICGARDKFRILSPDEGALLHALMERVCLLVDSHNSSTTMVELSAELAFGLCLGSSCSTGSGSSDGNHQRVNFE